MKSLRGLLLVGGGLGACAACCLAPVAIGGTLTTLGGFTAAGAIFGGWRFGGAVAVAGLSSVG